VLQPADFHLLGPGWCAALSIGEPIVGDVGYLTIHMDQRIVQLTAWRCLEVVQSTPPAKCGEGVHSPHDASHESRSLFSPSFLRLLLPICTLCTHDQRNLSWKLEY
jgi:hypothetical protein